MPFHQRLRQLLDENEITQKKLAADLHIAASTVGSYVQGVREPDFSILLRMADYFHVSADYLLDHREETAGPRDRELLRIGKDGIIDNDERPTFDSIVEELGQIVEAAMAVRYAKQG